jgi:uncharacterized NAD(P)/FAD-binding protein YdhS
MSIEAMQVALGALDWAADHITPKNPINCDCPVCVASDVLRRAIDDAERKERDWQDKVDSLYVMYQMACQQRDELMDQQRAQIAAMHGRLQ